MKEVQLGRKKLAESFGKKTLIKKSSSKKEVAEF